MGDLAAGWRECETPSGVKYYYNSSKNECRWVRPVDKEGDGAEDDDQVQDVTERMLSAKKRKLESEMVDVSGSAAVEDLCSERVALQSRLSCKDAILDPGVKVWMRDWIRRDGSADRDVDHLIEMLSSGYEGYGEYVGMLVRWLDMLGNCGEKAVEDHFKTLVLAQFNAVKFEGEMSTHKDTPPKWLVGMLSNPVWRGLLINLAEKQQERRETSPLLDFAVKAICKAGHHAEVAAVLNTASYFAVFRRTFTDTLYGILDFEGDNERNPADLSKLEEKFRDLCCFSQYTYLFAMEALELLEESELKGDLFRSKVRRLRQGLANTPRKQDSRLEAIQLSNPINRRNEGGLSATALSGGFPELASIVRTCISNRTFPPETLASLREMYLSSTVPVWPVRRVEFLTLLTQHLYDPYREMTTQARQDGCYILSVACARGSNREQETFTAIESSVDIVKDSETMAVAEITHQSERMKKLAKMVKEYPPVACGVIRFARSCFLSSRFQKESCFSVGVRTLLSLIRCAVRTHPLQRVMAFFTICHSLQIFPTNVFSARLLELKQCMIDELVILMECGFVFQVLEYMRNQSASNTLDPALVRYFCVKLANVAGDPLSPEFAKAVLLLLNSENCARSVRSAHSKETTRVVNEFKLRCTQAGVVLGTNRNQKPLSGAPPQGRKETIRLVPFRP